MIKLVRSKRILWTIAGILSLSVGWAMPAFAQTATPDSVMLTIQQASISLDGTTYTPVFSSAASVDVVKSIGQIFGMSGTNKILTGSYKAIWLTITGISWQVSWSSTNPSPCDRSTSGTANGSVDLSGSTDFYFKTPDLGGNTLAYYQANPLLTGYIGDNKDPLVLASPVKVVANTPTTVNLILKIGNTLTCNGLSIFNRTDNSNVSPQQTISGNTAAGDKTGLNIPIGVYVDTVNNEIGVANSGNNSITIYSLTDVLTSKDGNVQPARTISGASTGLSSPTGIYVDAANKEIGVANSGNDSITIYDQNAVLNSNSNGNVPPIRTISGYFTCLSKPMGIYLDTINNEIGVANSGDSCNTGNNSVTIYNRLDNQDASPLHNITGTGANTGLNNPSGIYVDTINTEIGVANSGNNSITTYRRADVLKGNVAPARTISGASTGLSSPTGIYVDTVLTILGANVTAIDTTIPVTSTTGFATSGVIQIENEDILYTGITSSSFTGATRGVNGTTAASHAIGTSVKNNNIIGVANSGNNSVTIYDRTANGDVNPIRTISGANTSLNSPSGVYVDTVNNEIGVTHHGQQVVMGLFPSLYPSGTNNTPSTPSLLSGSYNLIFYGGEIDHASPSGIPIPRFFAERGTGSFVPATTPWPTFSFTLDYKMTRRLGDGSGTSFTKSSNCLQDPISPSNITNGTYNINSDGSFYAIIAGGNGTLQGTISADGNTFVASMYDSPNMQMLVYGVKTTTPNAPYLTSDGTFTGGLTDYLFASYLSNYTYYNPPQSNNLDTLIYQLSVGIAATGSAINIPPSTSISTITAISGDVNHVAVENSTGLLSSPTGGPGFAAGFIDITQTQNYSSYPNGTLTDTLDGLAGALTADGSTFTVIRNTTGCSDLGFGVGLRASPAGSFGIANLNGTYFTAAFGDLFPYTTNTFININTSLIRSTGGTLTFDGAGHATLSLFENAGGILSAFNQSKFTYSVTPQYVPSNLTNHPKITVDVLDLFIPSFPNTPYASALIGPNGQSLIFYSSLGNPSAANPTRLLGLALRQTPP